MKYLLIAVILLSGCSPKAEPKPRHFVCLTALGSVQIDGAGVGVSISHSNITVDRELEVVTISRSMCVEVQEK